MEDMTISQDLFDDGGDSTVIFVLLDPENFSEIF